VVTLNIAASSPVPSERCALAERLMTVTEEALDAITRITAQIQPGDATHVNTKAQTMASVSRSLREIAALIKTDEVKPGDDVDDDPIPTDIDELRYALARRIQNFIDDPSAGSGGLPAEAETELA
jgi:hypothetical protein